MEVQQGNHTKILAQLHTDVFSVLIATGCLVKRKSAGFESVKGSCNLEPYCKYSNITNISQKSVKLYNLKEGYHHTNEVVMCVRKQRGLPSPVV